jgi:hypothetical protein
VSENVIIFFRFLAISVFYDTVYFSSGLIFRDGIPFMAWSVIFVCSWRRNQVIYLSLSALVSWL